MPIPPYDLVRAADFKVGDVILRGDIHPCKIIIKTITLEGRIFFDTQYVGDDPFNYQRNHGSTMWTLTPDALRMRVRVKPIRNCAPCYDSDCECVYDAVSHG